MTDEKTRALIKDLREYATALRASVHVHHVGADLIEQAADTISALTAPDRDARDGLLSKKIAALEEKHQPILVWSGGAVPEPSHEVCSECGDDDDCAFFSELMEILAAILALSRDAAPEEPDDEPCKAETHSWSHYRPEQIDSYWIRCTRLGEHDEHEDSHTGLRWRAALPVGGETDGK